MGGGIGGGGAVNGGGGGGDDCIHKKTECSKTKPLHCTENKVQ